MYINRAFMQSLHLPSETYIKLVDLMYSTAPNKGEVYVKDADGNEILIGILQSLRSDDPSRALPEYL